MLYVTKVNCSQGLEEGVEEGEQVCHPMSPPSWGPVNRSSGLLSQSYPFMVGLMGAGNLKGWETQTPPEVGWVWLVRCKGDLSVGPQQGSVHRRGWSFPEGSRVGKAVAALQRGQSPLRLPSPYTPSVSLKSDPLPTAMQTGSGDREGAVQPTGVRGSDSAT